MPAENSDGHCASLLFEVNWERVSLDLNISEQQAGRMEPSVVRGDLGLLIVQAVVVCLLRKLRDAVTT